MWLNMPEMGVEGEAEVLDIGPAQVYDVRPGLVTGTFRHTSGEVYDLKLASESKPIGVTGTHPFWSVDREAWVSALDLEIGETLKTLEGTTVVESRVRRPEPEPVYNIEVEGDHVYRVGESGVLVHNASVPQGWQASAETSTSFFIEQCTPGVVDSDGDLAFYISGTVSQGVLKLGIRTKYNTEKATVSGKALFSLMIDHFKQEGTSITVLQGQWKVGDLQDNLDSFNECINNSQATEEECALNSTFTGKMASSVLQFGNVSFLTRDGQPGSYTTVIVEFSS